MNPVLKFILDFRTKELIQGRTPEEISLSREQKAELRAFIKSEGIKNLIRGDRVYGMRIR